MTLDVCEESRGLTGTEVVHERCRGTNCRDLCVTTDILYHPVLLVKRIWRQPPRPVETLASIYRGLNETHGYTRSSLRDEDVQPNSADASAFLVRSGVKC